MSRARAFTLIEVLVATAILAMVVTLCWSSFNGTFKTKRAVEDQSARYRTVRLALDRLSRDLSMAYLSQNEDTGQPERRTLFVGKRHFDVDEARFSFYGHQRLYQDANECDTAQVEYYGMRDREISGRTNLMRRESRRLQYQKIEDQAGETDIVCDDVVRLKLDYWDSRDKVWREEWVTNTADGQPDRLPSRVRITLTVHDERGKEVPFQTETRIAMQEPLNLKANDIPTTNPTTNTGTTTNPNSTTNPNNSKGAAPPSTQPTTNPTGLLR